MLIVMSQDDNNDKPHCNHEWILYTPFRGESFDICKHCDITKEAYFKIENYDLSRYFRVVDNKIVSFEPDKPKITGVVKLPEGFKCPAIDFVEKKKILTDKTINDLISKYYYKGGG